MGNEFWDKKDKDIQIGQSINLAFEMVNCHCEGMTYEQRVDMAMKLVPVIFRKCVAVRESIHSGKALYEGFQ